GGQPGAPQPTFGYAPPPGGPTTAGRVAACLGTGDAEGGSGASSGTPDRRGGAWSATGGWGGVRPTTGGLVAAPPRAGSFDAPAVVPRVPGFEVGCASAAGGGLPDGTAASAAGD